MSSSFSRPIFFFCSFFLSISIISEQSCYNQRYQWKKKQQYRITTTTTSKKKAAKNLLIIYAVHTLQYVWRCRNIICVISLSLCLLLSLFVFGMRLLFLICELLLYVFFLRVLFFCVFIAITNRHLSTKIRFIAGHLINRLIECKWHIKKINKQLSNCFFIINMINIINMKMYTSTRKRQPNHIDNVIAQRSTSLRTEN